MKQLILSVFTALSGYYGFAQAQQKVFPLGIIDEVRSVELNETRVLNIYLPEGYRADTATYPVLYLLDGSANEDFIHIVGEVQFLNMIQAMPSTIIVGIANVDRRRDFTFPTTVQKDKKAYPTTGSSEKFIAFLEKELEPYIDKKYHCNGHKTIIGESLGGLLAGEILLRKPGLFNDYILVSPSFWWDNESLLAKAPGLLKSSPDNHIRVCVSVGAEGKQMEGDARKFLSLLRASGKKNLKTYDVPMPEEDHLTILHLSAYKCLKLLNKK